MSYIDQITVGSTTYDIKDTVARNGLYYGVCGTAADTVAKTVTIDGISELTTGLTVAIKFKNKNTASAPTLNINNLGAINIKQYGTTNADGTAATTGWQAGSVVILVYGGSYWYFNKGYNTNSTYTAASAVPLMDGTATVGTATKYAREDHIHPTDTSRAANDIIVIQSAQPSSNTNKLWISDEDRIGVEIPTFEEARGMGVTNATTGEYLKIAAVDSNGTPTEYTTDGKSVLYYPAVAVASASTSSVIATVSNADITVNHILTSSVFANPSRITSDITWTTAAGELTLTGTSTATTTVDIVLVKKDN